MRSRCTDFPRLRWYRIVMPLVALLAGSAIAAPPAQPQDADAPYSDARGGFDDGTDNIKPSPLPWSQLSPEQRAFLMPLKSQWNQLPARRQQRMAGNVEKWRQFPPQRQAQIQQRITRWAQMTPQQRFEAAANARKFQAMPPAERQQRQMLFQKFRAEREARQRMDGQQHPPPPR